jgi:hypothetical protein
MDPVPDATTLIKLNQRFCEDGITGLNELKTLSIKAWWIRIDCTTVEARISWPNDVGINY